MFDRRKTPARPLIEIDKEKLEQLGNQKLYVLFLQDNWKQLSRKSRLALLQEVENRRAAADGREPARLVIGEDESFRNNPGLMGSYHPGTKEIMVNYRFLDGDSGLHSGMSALGTVLHEGRHAFQFDSMDKNDGRIPAQVLKEWFSSKAMYFSSGGSTTQERIKNFSLYQLQPIEMDARRFSRKHLIQVYMDMRSSGIPTDDIQNEITRALQIEIGLIQNVRNVLTLEDIDKAEREVLDAMREEYPDMDLEGLTLFDSARMILKADNLSSIRDYLNLINEMDRIEDAKLNRIRDQKLISIRDRKKL